MNAGRALEALWWRQDEPGWARLLLSPLSLLAAGYAAGAALARALARPGSAGVPVVSIGNLCAGGAGKTPVALFLCQRLLARGARPAVLSRGYGGAGVAGGVAVVCDGAGPRLSAREAGDEPLLLALRCPRALVLSGPRRALLAAEAVRRGADVLLLDDGLQHHALARDLDVVVADATNPLGNGRLLPRGPLREGPSALERVGEGGLLWLTNSGGGPGGARLEALLGRARKAGLAGPVESALEAPSADLRGVPVFLLCAIARPERFAAQAAAAGARAVGQAFFSDHHAFSAAELAAVAARARAAGAARILTTEKDLVRLHGVPSRPALRPSTADPSLALDPIPWDGLRVEALRVELRLLRGAAALDAALDRALAARPRGAGA